MNAAQLMHLANAVRPSLIILTRKAGPNGPELNAPAPANTYHEASELLAKWAVTAPAENEWNEPHRVEVELFWGVAMGLKAEESVSLVVPLKRCFRESGYDLQLHLKRFAASMGALESAAKAGV